MLLKIVALFQISRGINYYLVLLVPLFGALQALLKHDKMLRITISWRAHFYNFSVVLFLKIFSLLVNF